MLTERIAQVLRTLRRMRPDDSESDEAMLRRFLDEGDESAFEVLLQRHGPMVLGVCERVLDKAEDIEDAFQATFLILFRKAGSIRKVQSVGSWLYGVAYRTAKKALALNLKRRERERQCETLDVDSTPLEQLIWKDLRPVRADEEIHRLAEKYRAPLLLCYVQGRTYEEAARHLGWSLGTVSTRLTRAREILRSALSQRGITVAGSLLITILSQTSSAVSPSLASRALLNMEPAALPVSVQALAQGVIQTMSISKFSLALVLTIGAFLAISTVGIIATQKPGTDPGKKTTDKPGAKGNDKTAKGARTEKVTTREQILDEVNQVKRDFDMLDDPTITLKLVLQLLSAKIEKGKGESKPALRFEINQTAFNAEGLDDVAANKVLTKPMPEMKNVTIADYLRKLLQRLNGGGVLNATFVVRKDYIEITTENELRKEIWGPNYPGPFLPLVNARFEKATLSDALKKLAEQASYNILIDSRVKDPAKVEITATLKNMPLDSAVLFMTDMAELGLVHRHNVLYITSPENAEKWRTKLADERKRLDEERKRAIENGLGGGLGLGGILP